MFKIFFAMQRVEKLDKIFGYVEAEADVYYPANERFNLRGDIEAVVTENTRNGHDGNHQAANPQNPLDAVFVVHNVNTKFSVVLVVISEKEHYRLILIKLSISRSLPNNTKTSPLRITVELSGTPIMCCFVVSSLFSISSKLRRIVTKLR